MSARRAWLIAALLLMVAALGATVAAGSGHRVGLDTSYGKGGVAKVPLPEPQREGVEGGPPFIETFGFAAAPDGSAYVLGGLRACGERCRNGPYLVRFDPRGNFDGGFEGDGRLRLSKEGSRFTVAADGAGGVLVAAVEGGAFVINRYRPGGATDIKFGHFGTVVVHGDGTDNYPQLRLLRSPDRRILLSVTYAVLSKKKEVVGGRIELFRFLPDGRPDRTFGKDGAVKLKSRHADTPRSVTVARDGAILLGGSPCCGARRIHVERVGPRGRTDHRFDRAAASSVRRLSALGEFPTLAAVVPRADGGLVAIGSSQGRHGFYLRLRADGHLVRGFGRRGLVRLPFIVDSAVPGTDGAIFAVGEVKPYSRYYHAFRILPSGRPDPAYDGDRGIRVPLAGVPARVASIGGGRNLVTDKGDFECRSYCPSEPAIAGFRE